MKRFALLIATIAALVLSSVTSASADQLRGNRFAARTAHTTVAKLATSGSAATLGRSSSGILPATGARRAFYAEVQRQWWQWDGAFVVSNGHPGLDPTGALCGKKQNGAAWLLETGDVATERTCRVPAGRLIYMPVAMVICSPLIGNDLRSDELQACASGEFDALDFQFRATLDGRPVDDLLSYRTQTGVFTLKLPADNLYAYFGLPAPGGRGPAAADSIALLLLPPRPGTHVLFVSSSLPDGTVLATTRYTLIVGDRDNEQE
jgi:hypothetical protein